MQVAVPKERMSGERRVALVPDAVAKLVHLGLRVQVEADAGAAAHAADRDYERAGATVVADPVALWRDADAVLKVRRPVPREPEGRHEADLLKEGALCIALLEPDQDATLIQKLLARRVTSFAMEFMPRLSRAQGMDVLSSQSTVTGYLSVVLAAEALPKFFPLLMTAAGTIPPARVLILGAGVAGLQAIATARRLGAKVEAFDVRPAVKEQVESLGARFVGLGLEEATGAGGYATSLSADAQRREQALIAERLREVDVVIAAALVPGQRAPVLIREEMVAHMKPGSVIVDLAAEQGGNCALTRPGERVQRNGVTLLGPVNLASAMAQHASQLFARNLLNFFTTLLKDGAFNLDFDDEVVRETCVTHAGELRAARLRASPTRDTP